MRKAIPLGPESMWTKALSSSGGTLRDGRTHPVAVVGVTLHTGVSSLCEDSCPCGFENMLAGAMGIPVDPG